MLRLEKFLVLALLVFLPSQLAYHWWPSWSLVSGVRVDYLSPTIYFTDLLVIMVLIFGFWQKYIKISKVLLVITVGALINIYFSTSPLVSIYTWLRFLELFLLGCYFFSRALVLKPIISAGLIVALLWIGALAIWQSILQHSVGGAWYFLGERSFSVSTPGIAKLDLGSHGYLLRAYATLPHPNALAAFVLISMLLIFYFSNRFKKLWLIAWPIFLVSWSRSVIVAVLALIFPWVIPMALLFPGNPTSFSERWQLNILALHVVQNNFWTGVGLGGFLPYLQGSIFQPVHNIFLLTMSELGIFFSTAIIVYLIKVLINLAQNHQWLLLKIFLIVLGLGLVDHYWLTLHQTQLLLTIVLSQTAVKSKNL